MKSIEEKAELWDYYQDLVKSSGFDGVTDLLAENKRLRAVIDAANAQEPLAKSYKNSSTGTGIEFLVINEMPEGETELYARPIPAQQSQVSGEYENALKDLQEYLGYESISAEDRKMLSRVIHVMESVQQSPRITEQDALTAGYREEWKRNVMLMWSCVRKHDSSIPSDVLDYMREQLLNKLNNRA